MARGERNPPDKPNLLPQTNPDGITRKIAQQQLRVNNNNNPPTIEHPANGDHADGSPRRIKQRPRGAEGNANPQTHAEGREGERGAATWGEGDRGGRERKREGVPGVGVGMEPWRTTGRGGGGGGDGLGSIQICLGNHAPSFISFLFAFYLFLTLIN